MSIARRSNLALFVFALVAPALAAWPDDPTVNVPVSLAQGAKSDVFVVTDGAGGAIVAWEDQRTDDRDLYAQRVAANGTVLWTADGVPVCTAAGDQALYHSSTSTTGFTPLVSDGTGGAWIVWQDERAFAARARDVYVQHLDAGGHALLTTNGVAVAARTGMEDQPTACRDGADGLIVVWQDKNDDPVFYDIHAQRIDGGGQPLWNGGQSLPVVAFAWDQDGPTVCADGQGGAFVAWSDARDDVGDVYAQRLDTAGTALWTANGIPVATGSGGQDAITARRAEDGDVLLAWVDRRSGSPDIYGQKLAAANGAPRWTAGGSTVCTAAESQYRPALDTDGASGAVVAWFDYRDASGPPWNLNIYAQRITAAGAPAWALNGVAVCAALDAQRDVDLVADGSGGAFLAWEDNRSGTGLEDIYAQHVDDAGRPQWADDGVAVCVAPGNQQRPDLVRGADGIIVTWPDDRDSLYEPDVYCDRVRDGDATAVDGVSSPHDLALTVLGGPDAARARLSLSVPHGDALDLAIFDVRGRHVRTLLHGAARGAGTIVVTWDRRDGAGRDVPAGVYLVRAVAGGTAVSGRVIVVR